MIYMKELSCIHILVCLIPIVHFHGYIYLGGALHINDAIETHSFVYC
jgi:hypothetical protein